MAKKKGSFMERLLMGAEKSEGYARSTLPSNRWELFWDIFKGRFGKIFILNLIMLAFALPIIALIVARYLVVVGMGTAYPFSQPFGLGYLAPVSVEGYAAQIAFRANLYVFLLLPLAFMIFGVGLSGGAYVARNMIWTEGIFIANDFWLGIKRNIKQMLLICLFYSVVFYVSCLGVSVINVALSVESNIAWLLIVAKIFIYVFTAFYTVMSLHMITMTVTYEVGFFALIKNSFLMTFSFIPLNIIFIFLGMLPFLLLTFSGIFMLIGALLCIVLGFSLFLLVWTDYCQWIYDSYVNPKRGYERNRGIYSKVKESDAESVKLYKKQIDITTASSFAARPIKPITDDELKLEELPQAFTRADLERLNESKQRIYDDHARYVEEHKDDAEFEPFKKAASDKETEKINKRVEAARKELEKRDGKRKKK